MKSCVWTGDNLGAVRSFLEVSFGPFPGDWLEQMPDGSLFIMADHCVFVEVGEAVVVRDGKVTK